MFALKYLSERHLPADEQNLWMKYRKTRFVSLGDVNEFKEVIKATDVSVLWLSSMQSACRVSTLAFFLRIPTTISLYRYQIWLAEFTIVIPIATSLCHKYLPSCTYEDGMPGAPFFGGLLPYPETPSVSKFWWQLLDGSMVRWHFVLPWCAVKIMGMSLWVDWCAGRPMYDGRMKLFWTTTSCAQLQVAHISRKAYKSKQMIFWTV